MRLCTQTRQPLLLGALTMLAESFFFLMGNMRINDVDLDVMAILMDHYLPRLKHYQLIQSMENRSCREWQSIRSSGSHECI